MGCRTIMKVMLQKLDQQQGLVCGCTALPVLKHQVFLGRPGAAEGSEGLQMGEQLAHEHLASQTILQEYCMLV